MQPTGEAIECVDGIVVGEDGRLLMVLRGHEPSQGTWSVPGGRKEPGETDAQATAREVLEETGVHVRVGDFVGTIVLEGTGGPYVISAYSCTPHDNVDPAAVRAGDDAEEAGWFTAQEVRQLDCAPGLLAELEQWGVLDRLSGSSAG